MKTRERKSIDLHTILDVSMNLTTVFRMNRTELVRRGGANFDQFTESISGRVQCTKSQNSHTLISKLAAKETSQTWKVITDKNKKNIDV